MDLKRFKSLDTIAEKASWSLAKERFLRAARGPGSPQGTMRPVSVTNSF